MSNSTIFWVRIMRFLWEIDETKAFPMGEGFACYLWIILVESWIISRSEMMVLEIR